MILATITVDEVFPHQHCNPPSMTIHGHYAVPPVPVIRVEPEFGSDYLPTGRTIETQIGVTDRANTSITVPLNEAVRPRMKITVRLEQ